MVLKTIYNLYSTQNKLSVSAEKLGKWNCELSSQSAWVHITIRTTHAMLCLAGLCFEQLFRKNYGISVINSTECMLKYVKLPGMARAKLLPTSSFKSLPMSYKRVPGNLALEIYGPKHPQHGGPRTNVPNFWCVYVYVMCMCVFVFVFVCVFVYTSLAAKNVNRLKPGETKATDSLDSVFMERNKDSPRTEI